LLSSLSQPEKINILLAKTENNKLYLFKELTPTYNRF